MACDSSCVLQPMCTCSEMGTFHMYMYHTKYHFLLLLLIPRQMPTRGLVVQAELELGEDGRREGRAGGLIQCTRVYMYTHIVHVVCIGCCYTPTLSTRTTTSANITRQTKGLFTPNPFHVCPTKAWHSWCVIQPRQGVILP